ncbi:MAG TPA: methyl-accepting chemotaxis protein, partial [Calditrichia bacterium]|nr:methyl-accepting chemotaxis protein [Calditrichia bacterium]
MFKASNFNIKAKLLISLVGIGLFATLISASVAYFNARNALKESEFNKLKLVKESLGAEVENYFATIRSQVHTFANSYTVIQGMKLFKETFHGALVNEREQAVLDETTKGYYQKEFLTRLSKNLGTSAALSAYWPQDPETRHFQYYYLSSNKNPAGSKHLLDMAEDGSFYSEVHAEYHPTIREYLEHFGYYDIFLIDDKTGHIVYSVFKEVDYATSLFDGPYKNTNFARAVREAAQSNDPDFVRMVDFDRYDPSYAAPAAFIAAPIFDHGEKVGVL